MYRLRAKHTRGSNPPPDLLPGELAYSDANKQFYVGRFDGSACTFESDLSLAPISTAIDGLAADIALLDSSQTAQDLAIAAIEADQGSQNDSIALLHAASASQADALTLLDATTTTQTDAIAAINTDQDSQDAAIAALAATNSTQADAIAALQARPLTYGFTYDQQAEPIGPTAGQTWRERSAGGLSIGEWEWSGSLWLSTERSATLYSATGASANTSGAMGIYPNFPALLTGYSAIFAQPFAPQDASNYWVFRHSGLSSGQWLTTINQSTTAPTALRLDLESPVVISAPSNADNFVSKSNSPGNLRTFRVITHYKLIRQ